ncbi:hypothetical protein CUR178_03426 [Leishmania enriettii]|uniref:Flagellar attachment zone protein 1 conserved domain-containing protein n=1 Tax=Leishmania enriettii TaxID=5663 RepID=A0A836KVI4_LEIEN|nr:hypothetical protein CUR178_03426 [Leishmania enriettii]
MLHETSPTAARRPRLAEPRLTPTASSSLSGGTTAGSLAELDPRKAGGSSEPHNRARRSHPRRSASPVLSDRDVLMAVQDRLEHIDQCIYPGSVVVYEFLDEAQGWHWALGTVQQADLHTVTLAGWSCQQGGASDGVMQALRKEENRIRQELEDHQAAILALRAELGAVRTRNEANMNATREAIEDRRRALENREGALHVCRQRGLQLQLSHSDAYGGSDEGDSDEDVFAAVMRAVVGIMEGNVPATPLPWPKVWSKVTEPFFLQRCMSYDVSRDMSLQQYRQIEALFFDTGAVTEAKVRRAIASMEHRMPDASEFLCVMANWLFTQLAAFPMYQQCASAQSHADTLQQRLMHHVNVFKATTRRLRQVQAQLRVFSGAPGSSRGASGSDVQFTFAPAQGVSTDVLRCAIICPVPSHSRRHPGPRAAASLTASAAGEFQQQSSSSNGAAMPTEMATSSRNSSSSSNALGDHNRAGSATDPVDFERRSHNSNEQAQPPPCHPSSSITPALGAAREIVLLGHKELAEIAARAEHCRPDLYRALGDLLQECDGDQRDARHTRVLAAEHASPPRERRGTVAPQSEGCVPATARVAAPFLPSTLLTVASSGSSAWATRLIAHESLATLTDRELGKLPLPGSRAVVGESEEEEEEEDEEYEEELDASASQAVLLGLQQLQEARRENEQLQRMLVRETDQHRAVEAELQRQLRDARADHERAQNRLADATIRAKALEVECESLHRDLDNAASRITALESEMSILESRRCSGASASRTATPMKCHKGSRATEHRLALLEAEVERRCTNNHRVIPQDSKPEDHLDDFETTHHHKSLSAYCWDKVLQQHPAELHRAAAADAAAACSVVAAAITGVHFAEDGSRVDFCVDHPCHTTQYKLDDLIRSSTFSKCEYVRRHCSDLKTSEELSAEQLSESEATIAELRERLPQKPHQPPPRRPSHSPPSHRDDVHRLRERLQKAEEEISELRFYDERTKKSGHGVAVATVHAVQLSGDDWGVVLQEHPEALREAFVVDVSHACHVSRQDVEHVSFASGTLQATVRVRHDADVTEGEMNRRLQEYDYPLTMELYGLRLGPKRGADAALATVAQQEREISETRHRLQQAEKCIIKAQEQQADKDAEVSRPTQLLNTSAKTAPVSNAHCTADEKRAAEALRNIDELRQHMARAQVGREALQAECDELQRQLEDLKKSSATATAEREHISDFFAIREAELHSEISLLRTVLQDAEERARDVAAQQADREAEMADLRAQLQDAEERARDAEAQQADREAEMADLRAQLQDAEERARDVVAQQADREAEMADLRAQLQDAEERARDVVAQQADREAEMADLRAQLQDAEERASDAEAQQADRDAATVQLQRLLDAAVEEVAEKDEEAVSLEREASVAAKSIDKIRQHMARAQVGREALQAECDELQRQLEDLKESSATATAEREQISDFFAIREAELHSEISLLRTLLQDAEERARDVETQQADREAEMADLRAQLQDAEERARDVVAQQADREAEMADLRAQLQDAEERASDVVAQQADREAEVADLRAQLQDAEERVRDAEAQQADREAEMADLRAQLQDAEERASDVVAQQADREAEMADLRAQLQDAEERVSDAEAQQADREAEMADLRAQLQDAEERVSDAEAQQADREAEMADLRAQLQDAEERVSDAEAQQADREAEMADLRAQLQDAEERVSDAEAQQADREAEMADLRAQLQDAEERARDAEAQQADREAEMADLRAQLQDAEERARDAEAQQADREAEMADLRAQLQDAEERARDAEAQQADREAEMADLRAQLQDAEERVSDAEAQQADREAEMADLRAQLQDAEERARDAEAQQADREAEMADLRAQLQDAEERVSDAEAQQADREAEMADLRAQLQDAEERVSDAEAQQADREAEMADLRAQLQDAEERARDAEAQQADREAEMADLRAQLQDAEERARDAEAQQADREAEMADLRAQLQDAEERVSDAEAQQADREAEVADLRAQLQDAEERARDVEAQQADRDAATVQLQRLLDAAVEEVAGRGEEVVSLEREASVAAKSIDELRQHMARAQVGREALQAECDELQRQLEDLKKSSATATAEREQISDFFAIREAELHSEISLLLTVLQDAEERARDVAAPQADREAEMADLRAQLQDAEERARDVVAQQADREAEMADLRAQLQDAEERVSDAEAQQADREAEVADLRAQLQDAEERASDVVAQQADREAEMADLRAQLQDAEERARDVEAQQADREAEMADLRAQLQDAEERARDVVAQQADREAEMADLRAQLQDAEERARDAEAQQADREAEMADLRAQLQDAEERARDAEAQQADREAEMADLRAQLQDAEERARNVAAQQADRDAATVQLQRLLDAAVEEVAGRGEKVVSLEREASVAAKSIDELRQHMARAQVGREALQAECDELQRQLEDLEESSATATAERGQISDFFAIREAELYGKVSLLLTVLQDAEERASDAEAQQADREAEMADLRAQLQNAEERVSDAEAQQADREAEMADLRAQLQDAEERVSDAEAQQADREAEMADLRAQLQDAEERASDVVAQQADREAEMADLRAQLQDAEERARDVVAQQADREAEMADLRAQLQDAEERARDVVAQQADREAEMADLRAQLQDAEERARDVAAQQADREAEMADLRAQLQDAEERARDVVAQQADREAEMADLRAQLQDAEERASDAEAQQADREAEMADLRAQLQDAEELAREVMFVGRQGGPKESEVVVCVDGTCVSGCCVAREMELGKALEVIGRLREETAKAQMLREAWEAECLDLQQHVLAGALSGEGSVSGESRLTLSENITRGCEKAEFSDLRARLRDAGEREKGAEAQQAEGSAEAFRLEELLMIFAEEESAKSERWAALEREVAEAALCVEGLRNQLAKAQVGREALVDECAGLARQLGEEEDRREGSVAERERLLQQVSELRFYDERTKKSGHGVAVATVHAVQLSGDDWGVVLQEHPEALREAFVVDVSHACHVSRQDVEHVSFASGTLQATVRVRHDADVTEGEMNRRLQEYDYPLTMELYGLRLGPKRGADAALATVAQQEREISRLHARLSLLEDETGSLRCAVKGGQLALRSVSRRVGERGSSFEGVLRREGKETRNENSAEAREGDYVAVLTLSEEMQRERLGRVMLEEALLLVNTFTGFLVNAYGERVRSVERELKCTSMECTDTLDKLEEFVRLLEGARAAEMAALRARDGYQKDLHALQARYDLAVEEKQRLLLLMGEGRESRDASVVPSWAECGIDAGSRLDDCEDTGLIQRSRDGVGGGRSPPESSSRAITPVGWQEQLEQLKREKEALMEELDARSVSYNDALTLLNLHISQLMEELSMHLRGGEASASNARVLLREISELRVMQGRTGALFNDG